MIVVRSTTWGSQSWLQPPFRRPLKQAYLVTMEAVVPAAVSIRIFAETEWEAAKAAIAESLGPSRCDIDPYDFLKVEGVTEITPLDPDNPGGKVWQKDEIDELLGKTEANISTDDQACSSMFPDPPG